MREPSSPDKAKQPVITMSPAQEAALRSAMAALQAGQPSQALLAVEQVLRQAPRLPLALLLRARVHRATGMLDKAWADCEQVLKAAPGSVQALTELALVQRAAEQPAEAEATYLRAIGLSPNDPVLHHNLANLLQRRQAHKEAEASYRQALALAPTMAEAHAELGRLLQAMGQEALARQHFAAAIQARPSFAQAWVLLGDSMARGEPVLSLHALHVGLDANTVPPAQLEAMAQTELKREPGSLIARYTLAVAQFKLNLCEAALATLDTVIARQAQREVMVQALYLKQRCLLYLGQITQALHVAQEVVALAQTPVEQARAWQMLGGSRMEAGQQEEGLVAYRHARSLAPADTQGFFAISCCAASNYLTGITAHELRALAESCHTTGLDTPPWAPHANDPTPRRRLRVGYVSGDFKLHSCAYFMTPLLARHDAAQFELFAYATLEQEDAVTTLIKGYVPNWRRVHLLSDAELAAQIRADGIDILVDLSGFSDGHRLGAFQSKPAPVQISWLGYLGTTGLPAMDYRLTDPWVDGPGAEALATEAPLRLNRPYVCYVQGDGAPPEVAPPPMRRLGHPTLGSFNAMTKLCEACLRLWAGTLRAIPDARLLIKNKALADAAVCESVWERLAAMGVARERVELRAWAKENAHHLQVYNEVDVCLDSYPYHGVTTTCEASWMGVPVVSLVGDTFASRQSLSLLTSLGLAENATHSPAEFVVRCQAWR
jgi:protein O-GlcNAc transferase